MRFRNVSCFVSDGSGQQDSSVVEDELCGDLELSVDGDKLVVLQETCTVPCPGGSNTTTQQNLASLYLVIMKTYLFDQSN